MENKSDVDFKPQFSAYERGRIDEIIKALEFLEKDKMISYAEEIDFLRKIRGF